MEIKELTARQLNEFIQSDEYRRLKVIPITPHRARSHINNPCVEDNDIILLLAYVDSDLVGYLGVLPDKIYLNDREYKVGWLSCLWIDRSMRGKGIAKELFNRALQSWNKKILITEFTKEAESLYRKSGEFMDKKKIAGLRGYLRFSLDEIIIRKESSLKNISFLFKTIDYFFNIFNDIRLFFIQNSFSNNQLEAEYVSEIDDEIQKFIEKKKNQRLSNRQAEGLNWINKFPWLLSAPTPDYNSVRYHFSSIASRYHVLNLKLYDKNRKLIAFILLTVRDNNLKIPYCYFENGHIKEVVNLVYHLMLKMKLNMVTVFHPPLVDYMKKNKSPFILKREIKRGYFFSKQFENELLNNSSMIIQDGDGDSAFT